MVSPPLTSPAMHHSFFTKISMDNIAKVMEVIPIDGRKRTAISRWFTLNRSPWTTVVRVVSAYGMASRRGGFSRAMKLSNLQNPQTFCRILPVCQISWHILHSQFHKELQIPDTKILEHWTFVWTPYHSFQNTQITVFVAYHQPTQTTLLHCCNQKSGEFFMNFIQTNIRLYDDALTIAWFLCNILALDKYWKRMEETSRALGNRAHRNEIIHSLFQSTMIIW